MTARILIIEPFYGGSHKQLIDLISQEVKDYVLFTMPAKKWPWHARTSALYFSQVIPETDSYRVLFCSSVLNLAELSALRPDLGRLRKVLYFHENQLVYPVRKHQERDFQFGYNQILSCLVADEVVFNSKYNQDSFLNSIQGFLKLIPDHRPTGLAEQIRLKCRVLYFPLKLSPLCDTPFTPEGALNRATNRAPQGTMHEKKCSKEAAEIIHVVPKSQTEHVSERNSYVPENCSEECEIDKLTSRNSGMADDDEQFLCHDMKLTCSNTQSSKYICSPKKDSQLRAVTGPGDELKPLHIVWAHRWEHDKDPGTFFNVLCQLQESRVDFRVSVLGECFHEVPDSFREARESLGDRVCVWGYQESKTEYYRALQEADVAVSTAVHEFFGVAMLEAANMGCFPLCPNRLVYPEIFPKECLYNTSQQLYKRLREFCRRPHLVRASNIKNHLNLERFNWETLRPKYLELLSADHS